MQPEKFPEVFYLFLEKARFSETEYLIKQLGSLAERYLKNESSDFANISKQYQSAENDFLLLLIRTKHDKNEIWMNFGIIKENKKLFIFCNDTKSEYSSKDKREALDEIKQLLTTLKSEMDWNSWSKSFTEAVMKCDTAVDTLSCPGGFNTRKFNKLVVEKALGMNFRSKETLEKFLNSFNDLLDNDLNFTLSDEQLIKMSSKLLSKNFIPRGNDKTDRRQEILFIVARLKAQGQFINETSADNIKTFCEQNRNCHFDSVCDFDVVLKDDPRDDSAKSSLLIAINKRIEFLTNIALLANNAVIPNDIDEVLGFMFDDSILKTLRERFENCNNELKELTKTSRDENENSSKIIDLSSDMRTFQKEINYIVSRTLINKEIMASVTKYIKSFSDTQIDSHNKLNFEKNTVMKLCEFSNLLEQENEIIPVLQILLLSNVNEIKENQITEKVFAKITQPNALVVTKLGLEKRFENPIDLIQFAFQTLCSNEDDSIRKEAFEVFSKYQNELNPSMSTTFDLENDFNANSGQMLSLVKEGFGLTLNTFNKLSIKLSDKQNLSVLESILESDLQKLPKSFVKVFIEHMPTLLGGKLESNVKDILRVVMLLVKGQYIRLGDVHNLDQLIEVEDLRMEILNIIFVAVRTGIIISEQLINKVKSLPPSAYSANIVRAITKQETSLDVVQNTRNDTKLRQACLTEIVNDASFHNPFTASILENLILFNDPLKAKAFLVLVNILPNNFESKSYNIKSFDILKSISNSKIEKAQIRKFIVKRFESSNYSVVDKHLETIQFDAKNIDKFLEELADQLKDNIELENIQKAELFNSFKDETLNSHFSKIGNLISENAEIFGISNEDSEMLFEFLIESTEFFKFDWITSVIKLIQEKGIVIPGKVIENAWNDFAKLDTKTMQNLLTVTHQIGEVSENVLLQVVNLLNNAIDKNRNFALEAEITAIKIVLKQQKITRGMCHRLEETCMKNTKNFAVNKFILQVSEKNYASEDFVKKFHAVLVKEAFESEKVLKILHDDFTQLNPEQKFERIKVFNCAMANSVEIEPDIITKILRSEWNKQILSSIVIVKSINNQNELELWRFTDILDEVEDLVAKENNSIMKVLHKLIEIQDEIPLSLSQINDIASIVQSSPKALEIFYQSEDFKKDYNQIEKIWLAKKLKDCKIIFNDDELNDLLPNLNFRLHLISGLLSRIPPGTKFRNLENFFRRVFKHKVKREKKEEFLTSLPRVSDISEWQRLLSTQIVDQMLFEKFTESEEQMSILNEKLVKMLTPSDKFAGWSAETIRKIVDRIQNDEDLEKIQKSLDPITEYRLNEFDCNVFGESLQSIVKNKKLEQLKKKVHELAIYQTFSGTFSKSFDQLLKEISNLNPAADVADVQSEFMKVIDASNKASTIIDSVDVIKNWKRHDVQSWALKAKSLKRKICKYEKVAVIKRAVELFTKFSPRDVQILSLLLMLNAQNDKGRLEQINTGEGKTTIVAMLAVFKALEGHKIDIITSSPELARPQSQEQKNFFEMFDLSVSHNGTDSVDIKIRYKADIVYGAAGDFQGDILRDEYSKMKTRSGRKCEVAIVDEVDSMLIDGRNYIVMLSSTMPAMNHLEPILAAIWIQIDSVANCIVEQDGKVFFVESEKISEDGKVVEDPESVAIPIKESKSDFIKSCTEKHVRKMIRDIEHLSDDDKNIDEKYPKLNVPNHLRTFVVEVQLPKWIDSAIFAKYKCELEKHYLIRDGKIVPVDSDNTGVVQQNTHWSNGIHQFLQIKHGAKITPEGLTTNYLSNVAFFQRYGSNIFGLTGTLGSEKARELLGNTYRVDTMEIPPFRQKQHFELTPIIARTESVWYEKIVQSSLQKMRNNRGVLVITKFIMEAFEIARLIKENLKASGESEKLINKRIKIYSTEKDAHVVHEELKAGEIVIATNIAGRGTDIKPSTKIEENGGLHVCVTFLPASQRVEQQNVGRTSRTGNKGTSQFILLDEANSDLSLMKEVRNILEEELLRMAEIEIKKILRKDKVFEKFCGLLDKIKEENDKKAVEERFGLWLQLQAQTFDTENDDEKPAQLFKDFEKEILNDKKARKLIRNGCYHVKNGNKFIDEKKFSEAIDEYSEAIELDENFAENAYYNRGYARLAQYGEDVNKNKTQISNTINDFERARNIINDREMELHIIQRASNSEALSEQVAHKHTLYNIQKSVIDSTIGADGADIDKQINDLDKKKNEVKNAKKIKEIDEYIKRLGKQKKGTIQDAIDKGHELEVERMSVYKSLPEDQDVNLYKQEIDEFCNNGYIGALKVSSMAPIDWGAVISLAAIGLVQIVSGAALAVFSMGTGSSIGMGLLTEGISDLITAVKDGIVNRNFDWKSWGIQKAISYTVSLLCAGFGAIKDAAKTAVAGVKQAANLGMKALTETVKSGWKIAAKAIGTSIAKQVASEIANKLVDLGVNQAIIPHVEEAVMKLIEPQIHQSLINNPFVAIMLIKDGENRNCFYENIIKTKALELLHKQTSAENSFSVIAKGIAKGVANHVQNKSDAFSNVMKIMNVINASKVLLELAKFVPNFIADLEKSIEEVAVKAKLEPLTSQSEIEVSREATSQRTTEQSTSSQSSYLIEQPNAHSNQDIDLTKGKKEQTQVKLDKTAKDSLELCKRMSNQVSQKMTSIIKSEFISPMARTATTFGVGMLTAKMDACIQNEIGDYQSERRVEFFQDKKLVKRIPKEFKKGMEDKASREKAREIIDGVKNGGETGLQHLGPISEVVDRPIKVLDSKGNVVRIIGEHKGGEPVEVQYQPPNESNPHGHYTLPGGVNAPRSGLNNCLLDVVASQTGHDPNQLRSEMVVNMNNNFSNIANQASDITRLEINKKQALCSGGRIATKDDETDLKGYLDSINDPEESGGPYKGMNKTYKDRGHASLEEKGKVDINHCPPDSCYKDTPYKDVRYGDMPSFAMRKEDHRGKDGIIASTGSSEKAVAHREKISVHMKNGEFYKAIEVDLMNVKEVCIAKGRSDSYNVGIKQKLQYCRDADIKGAPGRLITPAQYDYLVEKFDL